MNEPTLTLNQSFVDSIVLALEYGLENTEELLAEKDARLGRTTRSNRINAERLEGEIQNIRSALNELKKL